MAKRFKVIVQNGDRFGKRVAIKLAVEGNGERTRWHYRCDCGYTGTCLVQDLVRSKKIGSGCDGCGHRGPRLNRRMRPFESVYNIFVKRARHKVSITYDQYASIASKKPNCHYCNATIPWAEYRNSPEEKRKQSGSNLDRKDKNIGYDIRNVVPCCRRCNYGKNNFFTYEEWLQIGHVIRSWGKQDDSSFSFPQSGETKRAMCELQLEIERMRGQQ